MSTLTLHFTSRRDGAATQQAVASLDEAIATAFLILDSAPHVTILPLEVREASGAVVMDQEELLGRASDYSLHVAYPNLFLRN